MLKRIREKFGTAGLIVAIVALVVAVAGTAYAATKLNGTQKKEVEKIAKKFAGKDGATGAQGPAGAAGAKGDKGNAGDKGPGGSPGESVALTEFPKGVAGCNELGGAEVRMKSQLAGEGTEVCNGSPGQDAGFNYAFNSAVTQADPGSGNLALNNASAGSATTLSVSETDGNSNGIAAAITKWTTGAGAQGTLMIRKAGAPGTFAEYTVRGGVVCSPAQKTANPSQCGMTDEGTFENITVAFVAGNGTFAASDPVTVAYWSTATESLPAGAIESGTWAFTRPVETITVDVGGTPQEITIGNSTRIFLPISLAVPLAAALTPAQVHYFTEANFFTFCKGSTSLPRPVNSNELCVFQAELAGTEFQAIYRNDVFEVDGDFEGIGLGRSGGVLSFSKPTGPAEGVGSYAVKG